MGTRPSKWSLAGAEEVENILWSLIFDTLTDATPGPPFVVFGVPKPPCYTPE